MVSKHRYLKEIKERIDEGENNLTVHGLRGTAKEFFMARLLTGLERPCLFVLPQAKEAGKFYRELAFFLAQPALQEEPGLRRLYDFPVYDLSPLSGLSPHRGVINRRLQALYTLTAYQTRGLLVSDFLCGSMPAPDYLEHIRKTGGVYNGFNLIIGDGSDLYHYSNRSEKIHALSPGLYGLSNHLLDTPWPKVTKGKKELGSIVRQHRQIRADAVMSLLADSHRFADETLPNTGIGMAWERRLSSIFIAGPAYGTRSSAMILVEHSGSIRFTEATFKNNPSRETDPATRTVCFTTRLFPG